MFLHLINNFRESKLVIIDTSEGKGHQLMPWFWQAKQGKSAVNEN
ncbi:MAG TPA: hypothetical protein VMV77_17445 [Bacteroidales bacterium]|nr:hypothetical protein [Bacteroidales bacterium]